ncbi:uncharacterized protein LOC126976439 [Leptidea sinapis]|uniref:uncharacterized protein LOC126976439 n=1 Tax=Leptidea sinapis TaxID=189913 RepID=UPI0021C47093|nr:uncharacterized protein LOC126976439 [Leptidea sinapis]
MLVYKIFLVIGISSYTTEALSPDICKHYPKMKWCVIEYMSKDRWAHTHRFFYNWEKRSCRMIRWAEYCGTAPLSDNNFESEAICYLECGGWA